MRKTTGKIEGDDATRAELRRISTDSFRRMSALLKGPEVDAPIADFIARRKAHLRKADYVEKTRPEPELPPAETEVEIEAEAEQFSTIRFETAEVDLSYVESLLLAPSADEVAAAFGFAKPAHEAEEAVEAEQPVEAVELLEPVKAEPVKTALLRAELIKAKLLKIELAKTRWAKAELEKAELEKAELEKAELEKAELEKAELEKAELEKAELEKAELEKAELAKAELAKAELEKAELEKAELAKAELIKAELIKAEPQESAPADEPSQMRLARGQRKPADAFSLTPDSVAPRRVEAHPVLTPQQQAESAELARSLMDMMAASGSNGQPQERALAADTLLRLLPRLPTRTRSTLAQRLTMMDAPPPFLVAKLIADDDPTISGPLLEECMQISEADLLQTIDSRNGDKRRLIARRRRISKAVTEALAATGENSVLLTLLRNQGAEFSNEGFSRIARIVPDNMELLAPLCTRQDLPIHFAFELFWMAPAQLRRYLLNRFLTDSENLTKILRISMDSHGEDQAPAPDLNLDVIGQALAMLARDDVSESDRDAMIVILASAARVRSVTVKRIIQDSQGEPLMTLLKVIGMPRSKLEIEMQKYNQGARPLIDPTRALVELQSMFDQLSFTKARTLITYWDWAATRSGPYADAN